MSLTKNYYDAELEQMETTEEEGNAMYYYELERRRQLWIDSLPEWTEQAEIDDYLSLKENHWFSPMFERWIQVQNESKEIQLLLRRLLTVEPPQIASIDPKQLEEFKVWSSIFSIDTENNRRDLINRNGDL